MKIAVAGKGGAGKTTIAGLLARLLARSGHRVLAIDADPNPNLAVVLGLLPEPPLELTPIPPSMAEWRQDADGQAYVHLQMPVAEIEQQYGVITPDNITLLVTGAIEQAGAGCMCQPHAIARGLIAQIHAETGAAIVTDMEAGLEHLSRGTVEHVDLLLLILEPYYRSLETGIRARNLAVQLGLPRIYAVANKVRTEQERQAVVEFCQRHALALMAVIPFDDTIPEADRRGLSPLDLTGDAPGIRAIRALAGDLERRVSITDDGH